jgi:peptidoglycan/LPS O-acetylase OafA/YrhL
LYRVLLASTLAIVALLWWFLHPSSIVTVAVGYTALAVFYATLMLVVMTDTPGLLARFTRLKMLRDLGEISYCVYLIHIMVLFLCSAFLLHTEPRIYDWRGLAVTLLAFVLTMVLARLSWRYYERPLVRRGHRYTY